MIQTNQRVLTLEEAKQKYGLRYTMEHKPMWAREPAPNGKYYAPHYRTDKEWYDNTQFPGEGSLDIRANNSFSTKASWPLGQWLNEPFDPEHYANT